MSYFEGISANTLLMTVTARTLPIGLFLSFVHPAFVVILEFFLEYVDGVGALCIDRVSNVVYDRFDKLFDGISILFFVAYMIARLRNATTDEYRARNYWVPWVLALALYRVVGIIVFLAGASNAVFVVFANAWLPLFFLFVVLELWGVSLTAFRKYPQTLYIAVVLLLVYKFLEETAHHGAVDPDYIELSCGAFSTTFTHSDAFQFGRMIFASFTILILLCIRNGCMYCRGQRKEIINMH